MAAFVGTTGNDSLVGGADDDNFFINDGGNDVVRGAGGDDIVFADGAFTAKDKLDGGDGTDTLSLDGDYSAGLALTATNLHGIEDIVVQGDGPYKLSFADGDYGLDMDFPMISVRAADYTVTAPMDIDGSALTTMGLALYGGAGDDILRGGALGDGFNIRAGGNDTVLAGDGDDSVVANGFAPGDVSIDGGAGDDSIDMDFSFNLHDTIDGGDGTDWVDMKLGGFPRMTLSDATISQVENILITSAGPVDLKLADSLADNRLETGYLAIYAFQVSDSFRIDGGAERDTSLHLTGGEGDDWLRGGAKDDVFDLTASFSSDYGHDTALGGKGDDTFIVEDGGMNAAVSIDGGGGHDVLQILQRNFVELVDISGVSNVEKVILDGTTNLLLGDGNVAKGRILEITVDGVGFSSPISIDGSAETNGRLSIISGWGDDTLIGGNGADTIIGSAGADTITGGLGADRFVFVSVSDSAPDTADLIADLTAKDIIDLRLIDANANLDGDQAFKLVDHFTGKAGQAVLSYDKGAGVTSLSLDVDGDGAADSVIQIQGNQSGFTHFVL